MTKRIRHRRRPRFVETLESRRLLAADPLVTEVLARNEHTLDDGDALASDWVELLNAGDEALDLAGWHLTDDPQSPRKWTFPTVRLEPQQRLVVFASGQDDANYVDAAGSLHATFKLSGRGEAIALTRPDGSIHDQFAFPQQYEDISFGLAESSTGVLGYLATPTPGEPNGPTRSGVTLAEVTASRESGVFTDSVTVSLNSTASSPIHFTLDGAVPGRESAVYNGPLMITQSTQLRARVIVPDEVPGPVTSRSYVQLDSDVADFASQLPIMVIHNFGAGDIPNTGWNGNNASIQQLPRQAANLMMFDATEGETRLNRSPELSSRIGIRVRGAFSSSFEEPGLSVETWSEGGDVDADVSLLGIASDSDWVLYAPHPVHDATLIDNSFMFDISNQMAQWAPDVRYVETFINTAGGPVTMDDHVGLYVITEKVKRTPDRLAFERFAPDGSSGGWILDINRLDSIALDGTRPRNFHTAGPDGIQQTERDLWDSSSQGDDIPRQWNGYINYDDPNGYRITPAQRDAIADWFMEMENVLYGRVEGVDWKDPIHGYAKYIDVQNFIDYFILNDISHNGDGLLISMWIYNPDPSGGGKLKFGPIWDVDLGSFVGDPRAELMRRTDRLWYGRLFEDPDFVLQYTQRWQSLRDTVLADTNMHDTVDRFFEGIGNDAAVRDGVEDWSERLAAMKIWLSDRAAAIDELFVPRPQFNQNGGVVSPDFELSIFPPRGEVYYTTDGSDPRDVGGAVAANAKTIETELLPLVVAPAAAIAIVPDAAIDAQIGATWRENDFVAGAAGEPWVSGVTGVGFDGRMRYDPLIGLDTGPVPHSVYIRIPFEVDAETLSRVDAVSLRMMFDDGFVAYLNGKEVARHHVAGLIGESVPFDANATASHVAREDRMVESRFLAGDLRAGTNVLAIQGLNRSIRSTDLLIQPELYGITAVSPPIQFEQAGQIVARAFEDGQWSGRREARFTVLPPGDLNGDGRRTADDIDLWCGGIRMEDPRMDLNLDGRVDQADLERFVEQLLETTLGDVNLDGRFDASDLESVFERGEYDDLIPANSTWSEGDWNCDGDFTADDLLASFQTGRYQSGAAQATPAAWAAAIADDEFHRDRLRATRRFISRRFDE